MSLTDSQQDRMSAMSHGRPFMRAHLTGTINEAWRLAAGMAYAGNALQAADNFILFDGVEGDDFMVYVNLGI